MKLNRLLRPLTRRTKRQLLNSASKAIRPVMNLEPLENRQMLSLTVNLEVATTNAKTATVTTVGQVVHLNVDVTVTGTTSGANDGFQSLAGSFLSTLTDGSYSVGGNLGNAIPTGPNNEYQANGAQIGTSQDLNGDGYLDAGSNNNSDIAGFFNARAGGIEQDGTVSGDSQTFFIGTLTYTVVNLNYGQATDINFRIRDGIPAGAFDAVWSQDGNGENDQSGTVLLGSPVVITDPNLTPPPPGSISGNVSSAFNGNTAALPGVTVFLDTNDTGSLAVGDPTTTTDSSGNFDLTGLIGGKYYLREVLPTGYTQTTPSTSPTVITLSTSQNLSGQDFIDAATGSIAGTVNQVVSGSSSAFPGVTVYIDTKDTGSLQSGDPTTTTASNGSYSFTAVPAGTYDIREVVPNGFAQTSPNSSPTVVTLTAGQTATGQNFTDTSTTVATGSISGTVSKVVNGVTSAESGVTIFLDTNGNGVLNSGEPSATTDSSGNYSFTGLLPNTYLLREVVPTGYKETTPLATPTLITIAGGDTFSGQDFTNTATAAQTGSIAGTVTKVVSGSSSAFAGVTVFLDTNNNGTLDSGEPSTTTNSSGAYSFTGLGAGPYNIREVVPTGYTQTSPGSSPTVVTLSAGQNATGENFTDTQNNTTVNASISGTVTEVINGVSTPGAGVTVYLDINNDGVLDGGDISAVTGAAGTFSFSLATPETYHLREVVPANLVQTSPSSSPTNITVAAGQQVTGQNFVDTGTYIPGSIAGEVYVDTNKSGKLTGGDPGIAGVEMYIDLKKDGNIDSGDPTTTTSSTGTYSFTGLAPGTYRVREVVPSGDILTDPNAAVGYFDIIVQSNWQIHGENWGNIVPTTVGTGSISGEVYSDANSNGKLDSGELGIPNVEMYIDLNKDGKIDGGDPTTITSSTGTYSFSGLTAGTYRVREVLLSGDSFTNPKAGYFDVVVGNAAVVTGQNFGNTGAVTLSGNVFNDVNGNGVQDSGEANLGSGWVVYCDLNNDGKFEANENNKTTLSNGTFEFVSLKAGTYTLRIYPKAGYTQTSPAAGFYTVTIAPGLPVSVSFGEQA